MVSQNVFKRYELKFLISEEQKRLLLKNVGGGLELDSYGRSLICSVYYDTPDDRLVRTSIERPVYKEKLRLRSYGVAKPDSMVFAELKKKYLSVVYKRRISAKLSQAEQYLAGGPKPEDSQIAREIDRFMEFYRELAPAMYISYEREAFFSELTPDLRVTFDDNILWRTEELSLSVKPYGTPVLPPGKVLMEIKTGTAIPLWLVKQLSQMGIYKTSFSKYGSAYTAKAAAHHSGGKCYAG